MSETRGESSEAHTAPSGMLGGDGGEGFGALYSDPGHVGGVDETAGGYHSRGPSVVPSVAQAGNSGRVHGESGFTPFAKRGDTPVRSFPGSGSMGRVAQGDGTGRGPNLGLARKSGRRRVVGGDTSIRAVGEDVRKSYVVASGIAFNDVEELRGDAISRSYAQELLERLWEKWGLDTSVAEVMRKAEDLVHALFAMRTASPDADYSVVALLGNKEVSLQDLADLLSDEEVTRRRFARAIADDIRAYIANPENGRLREMLTTELGVKSEYAHLAFDGSTHCSGMSANQIMFTKQLERMNLFDTQEARDRLGTGQMLTTGQFQVNKGKGDRKSVV